MIKANHKNEIGSSRNPNRAAEQYRPGPLARWRLGSGDELLHFLIEGASRRIPTPLADFLSKWTVFLNLDEAIREACAALPGLEPGTIAPILTELIGAGCLIARSGLLNDSSDQSVGSRISWLAMPTSNRSALAGRACRSYAENMSHFGHRCGILVSDDSRDSAESTKLVEFLSGLRGRSGFPVWYCGALEKGDFARRLCKGGAVPAEVVNFALFGRGASAPAIGANRNSILLHTIGSLVLSVDDDTVCDPGTAPGTERHLVVAGHQNPSEVWAFHDFDAASHFVNPSIVDVIGEHAKYLGRPIRTIAAAAESEGTLGTLDGLCGHIMRSLARNLGFIRTTYNGSSGDSGWHTDFGLVALGSRSARSRVRNLNDRYQPCMGSRQIVRQALRPTISHTDYATVAMCVGLDNSQVLAALHAGIQE